jgi:hypothetical protein
MPPKKLNPRTNVEAAMDSLLLAGQARLCIVATFDVRKLKTSDVLQTVTEALDALRNQGKIEAATIEWPPTDPHVEDVTHLN